jgi:RimJ/RimL family protein N-acetyltransferase
MVYPILTPKLTIEPLQLRDLDTFVEYRRDPEVARYQSWESDYSARQALDLFESQIGVTFPECDQWLQLGIRLRDTDQLVGDLAIHNLGKNVVEIGFTISRPYQRKGFAREAVSALMQELVRKFETKSCIATPDSRNTASIRLLETLGFSEKPELGWWAEFKGERVHIVHYSLILKSVDESLGT